MKKEVQAVSQKKAALKKRIAAIVIVSLLIVGLVVTPLIGLFL